MCEMIVSQYDGRENEMVGIESYPHMYIYSHTYTYTHLLPRHLMDSCRLALLVWLCGLSI